MGEMSMQVTKRTTGVELWLLVMSVAFVFASMAVDTSHAQTSGSSSKSAGTVEDLGPNSGDPDMPGSDTPQPSAGSGTTGSIDGGSGVTQHSSPVAVTPAKRYGAWAHWKFALKLYLALGLR
jgi:hypothetical protein